MCVFGPYSSKTFSPSFGGIADSSCACVCAHVPAHLFGNVSLNVFTLLPADQNIRNGRRALQLETGKMLFRS